MSWNARLNAKRIRELEEQVGITYDPEKINYWQELNDYAGRVFLKEIRKERILRYSYTLPEYLQFARALFYRLINVYMKLYLRILTEKHDEEFTHKISIDPFGYVPNTEYKRIKLALLVQILTIKEDVKNMMLDTMSDYVLRVSGRLAELKVCL